MEKSKLSAVGARVLELGRQLVDHPSQVSVTEVEGAASSLIELKVSKPDYGKVIGKKGLTADNVRHLLTCISGRTRHKYTLDMIEPPLPPSQGFPAEPEIRDPVPGVVALLRRMLMAIVDAPQEITIKFLAGSQVVVFEVEVNADDYKRALGRGGRNISAIRELAECIGAKHGMKFKLELVDPQGRPEPQPTRSTLFGS